MGDLVRRRLGTVIVLGLLLLVFSASRIAVLVTDYWWFDTIGFREVFTTRIWTQILVGVVFGAVLALLIAVNLFIARRMRPFFVPSTPQQAQVQRYRDLADPYLPWIIVGIALVFGVTSGITLSASWESWLLFFNGGEVGATDPTFDRDAGFYMFQLPLLQQIQTWLFTSLILTALLSAGAHYLLGGIRPEAEENKILPGVKAHLAILLALVLSVHTWGYWLNRYELNFSDRGTVMGASYTDVNADLPALYILMAVTGLAIILVLMAIRRRGFLLPGAAVALVVVGALVLQAAYPAAIQRLRVDPQELAREQEYIAHNIDSTTEAFGLDDIDLEPLPIANDLSEDDVIDNDVTLRNVRLWDTDVLETTYSELQALRPYYEFNEVSIDRYQIDGELRQVMIATRELSELQPEADSWQNRHITYTHGFGTVASQVNTANEQGQPVFLSSNIPPSGEDEIVPDDEPGIYFGDFDDPPYNLLRTEADELDYEDAEGQEQVLTEYDGNAGVPIGGLMRRMMFGLRFADYNLVLTNLLEDDSVIIYNRQISERVQQVAPFLELDRSPYPVVHDGRVKWIVDAYTTSNNYPYSERQTLEVEGGSRSVNYVRNSVKVVVDAYDGDVDLYRVEEDDAVLDAWESVFPDVIQPVSEAGDLADHFRYPQDLFRLQAELYTLYHIPDAPGFYNRADAWSIPTDPAFAANQGSASTADLAQADQRRLEPYYLLMRLPGEEEEEFVLIQPYLARERPNMVAWLAGRSDGENLNEMFAVRFPTDQQVLGPMQAQARIQQDDDISAYITLRSREGSDVVFGNLQVLPIADSILYVQPLFLENPQAQIPELARVALVMGERTAFDQTLAGALSQLIGVEVPDSIAEEEGVDVEVDPVTGEEIDPDADPTDDPDPDPQDEPDPDPQDEPDPQDDPQDEEISISEGLLVDALEAMARAEDALADSDLGTYQAEIANVQDLLEQAADAEGISIEELLVDVQDDDGNGNGDQDQQELTDAELLEELEGAGDGQDESVVDPDVLPDQ